MTGSSLRSDSSSPASFSNNSPHGTPDLSSFSQKAANESYFNSMGQMNASRPADLPPSQGGRYQGFGSTPQPSSPSQNPSFGLTSAAAPTLTELQENPMAALSKGWSLFSTAVVGASKVINENVIQPGMQTVADPNLRASVGGYLTEAQKRATEVGSTANQWSKSQFGVDVAANVGGVVGTVRDRVSGGPTRSGYGSVAQEHDGETSGLYRDDEDDFFGEYTQGGQYDQGGRQSLSSHAATSSAGGSSTAAKPAAKKDGWDDEWKDF